MNDTQFSFNPRARVGRDQLRSRWPTFVHGFNPRARVGRDNNQQHFGQYRQSFNPRARVGRDDCIQTHA